MSYKLLTDEELAALIKSLPRIQWGHNPNMVPNGTVLILTEPNYKIISWGGRSAMDYRYIPLQRPTSPLEPHETRPGYLIPNVSRLPELNIAAYTLRVKDNDSPNVMDAVPIFWRMTEQDAMILQYADSEACWPAVEFQTQQEKLGYIRAFINLKIRHLKSLQLYEPDLGYDHIENPIEIPINL